MTRETVTLDHKVPVCKGGAGTIDNLLLACQPCNVEKNDEPYESFIASGGRRAAWVRWKQREEPSGPSALAVALGRALARQD